ncbi:MAG: hypothetical protein WDW38_000789 [Sanguina aurantia]
MNSPFKTDTLKNQVALVTGGSSGIGLEIATQLGLHGAIVVVTGRRQAMLDSACQALQAQGITAAGMQGDVRKADACERWVADILATYGRLDVLVNCAAGNFLATAEELTQNGFRTVMEIDAIGTFTMCRAAFAALSKSPSPSIVNISATLQYGATWWQVHASAAKSAVDSITRSLALEWGEFGIRVNGIAPGPIAGTAGMSKLSPIVLGQNARVVRMSKLAPGAEAQVQKIVEASIPLRNQMGRKWDIAMAALFLSSPAASFISGDVLVVDGVNWMWKPSLVPRKAVTQMSRGVEDKSRAVGTASSSGPVRSKL